MAVFDDCCATSFTSVLFNLSGGGEKAWWTEGGGNTSTVENYPDAVPPGKPVNDPTVKLLRLIADVYLTGPISVIGIVGNIVSFIVLCYNHKQRLRTVTILLQVSCSLILGYSRSVVHLY